jgi:CheY-like chemotaxis protein
MTRVEADQGDAFHFVFLDDSESLRESCIATGIVQLGERKVEVHAVADEATLLGVVEEIPRIDAVIVDIHLEAGHGYEVMERLFETHQQHIEDALVCFTCTEIAESDRQAIDAFSKATGLSVFWFGKPIQFREYFLVLASHFESKVVFEQAIIPALSAIHPDELRLEYFPNKRLASKRHFLGGVPHGSFEGWFFEGGGCCFLANYHQGQRHGEFIDYYEDGRVRCQGRFEHGLQSGVWNTYWPNGEPADQRLYEQGCEVGEPREWDETGNLRVRRDT